MSEGMQSLSEREKEALRLLLGGHDIKSIAASLGLSVHTINERLRDARRKLGVSSSRQAARLLAEVEKGGADLSVSPTFSADKEIGVASAAPGATGLGHSHRTVGKDRSFAWLAGGMLIMSLIIAAAVASFALQDGQKILVQSPEQIASAAPNSSLGAASARAWLALVDGNQWEKSWSAAGTVFKSQISAADWATAIQPVRGPLGAVSSRTLTSVLKATQLPGVPQGQYEVLQFTTNFEDKPGVIETVTLVREPAGWKVVGYFVK
ncbi:MAG: DUF4019 domain-containing protein [Phenylobacterium sp.]|uniref:helix-turn-helix domain-containing protein n=1 Tax=Phenylobacterium sp. TaxID=1871053 RepID=UPI00391CA306